MPVIGAVAAVITGNMAKKEIRQSAGRYSGMGMAKWGVILGWINIVFGILGGCFVLLVVLGVCGSLVYTEGNNVHHYHTYGATCLPKSITLGIQDRRILMLP